MGSPDEKPRSCSGFAQGKTNAEIGLIHGISAETVKKHLQHVYEELGVETRTAAATVALGWRSQG